jgi:hypothetical protein
MQKYCSTFSNMLAMQPKITPTIQASLAFERGAEGAMVQHALNRVNKKGDALSSHRIKKPHGTGSPKVSKHE